MSYETFIEHERTKFILREKVVLRVRCNWIDVREIGEIELFFFQNISSKF